jgi:orotate phosphoribosyltransferase
MHSKQGTWIAAYRRAGALWIHDGNLRRPHALLTSGKHSSGFFNSELVMQDPLLLDAACADLAHVLLEHRLPIETVDRVVGPAMGAITLAHDLARHLGTIRGRTCLRGYAQKQEDVPGTSMAFVRTPLQPGETVLAAEDVLTTGTSLSNMRAAAQAAGARVLTLVAVLVNRSGLVEVDGRRIVALIDQPMPLWAPGECPLCLAGSEAIRPKGAENWARLYADY